MGVLTARGLRGITLSVSKKSIKEELHSVCSILFFLRYDLMSNNNRRLLRDVLLLCCTLLRFFD
jgi:hypothetical protein